MKNNFRRHRLIVTCFDIRRDTLLNDVVPKNFSSCSRATLGSNT